MAKVLSVEVKKAIMDAVNAKEGWQHLMTIATPTGDYEVLEELATAAAVLVFREWDAKNEKHGPAQPVDQFKNGFTASRIAVTLAQQENTSVWKGQRHEHEEGSARQQAESSKEEKRLEEISKSTSKNLSEEYDIPDYTP